MRTIVICVALLMAVNAFSADIPPIAPRLMKSTFRVEGNDAQGKRKIGTCFMFQRPIKNNPTWAWNILVTANHVFSDIAEDNATVTIRMRQTNGVYVKRNWEVQIRTNGVPLWYRHPEADVAAMIVSLPKDFMDQQDLIIESLLAGDDVMEERDIDAGDELMCLGYPLGLEANESGFPILRSGRIASYPVRPSSAAKTFLYDIPVYGGNSGGPVFFDYRKRRIPGKDSMDWVDVVGVAGLISQDVSHTIMIEGYFESITRRDPLGLAIVVPGEFIKQAINHVVEEREK